MSDSQKFLSRNRAPRVQIEYDVEVYGAQKKVQLPFVMGVLSDLYGKAEKPSVDDRKFLEIDADNFDERMQGVAPKAQFSVPNTLTGEGTLSVDLTFEKMADFSPEAIAEKVDVLSPLLAARRQLNDLMAYMDGKSGAEALIENLLSSPALLGALAGQSEATADADAALDALKANMPQTTEPASDGSEDVLAALAARRPETTVQSTSVDDVLGAIEIPETAEAPDESEAALEALRTVPAPEVEEDASAEVLSDLAQAGADESAPEDSQSSLEVFETLKDAVSEVADDADEHESALAGLHTPVQETPSEPSVSDVLGRVELTTETTVQDDVSDVLAGLETPSEDVSDIGGVEDILSTLEEHEQPADTDTSPDDILASLDPVDLTEPPEPNIGDVLNSIDNDVAPPVDDIALKDVLAGIDARPEAGAPDTETDDVLASMEPADDVTSDDPDLSDVLGGIETAPVVAPPDEGLDDILAGLDQPAEQPETEAALEDVLKEIDPVEHSKASDEGDLDALLAGLEPAEAPATQDDSVSDVLADLSEAPEVVDASHEQNTEQVLSGLEVASGAHADNGQDDLDAMLADLGGEEDAAPEANADHEEQTDEPVVAEVEATPPVAEMDDLDAMLADLGGEEDAAPEANADHEEQTDEPVVAAVEATPPVAEMDDLDAMLADLGGEEDAAPEANADHEEQTDEPVVAAVETTPPVAETDDLDAMLADLGGEEDAAPEPSDNLDALLADLGGDTPMQNDTEQAENSPSSGSDARAQSPFGTISAVRPAPDSLIRSKFRLAVFGDFTGRATRGLRETGELLARRAPILLDVDTVEDVIEGFATTLTLPIGKEGAGLSVKLGELDDLHPDALFESVEIFEALSSLRQQLSIGSMAEKAKEKLKAWGEAYGTPVRLPKKSSATSVPAHLKLSDFQALIGDTSGALTEVGPADELIAQIVGPHIVKAADAGADAMLEAVDAALSTAMRLVLHHPDFQAVEAQWRSLDLLARRIETDSSLEIVLYDVSAEEIAIDLAAHEDLADSGLFQLLTGVLDPEEGAGGFSALFGLYTFEETPPHAELLARIGQLARHVDAPFFGAMTPAYLETAQEDRHPLVAQAWDSLRAQPAAAYVGLASPRFLLRAPYGANSEPCEAFKFEEFTPQEGLSGMLWTNPVVLVAILLAETFKRDGKAMKLGGLMSLGDLPFHYVKDRFGDQVALPCTERNLTSDPAQLTIARGFIPVLWMKGRPEVRLGSFRSLGGAEIAGRWSGEEARAEQALPEPTIQMEVRADITQTMNIDDDASLDDLLAELEGDDGSAPENEDIDAELAALLEGL